MLYLIIGLILNQDKIMIIESKAGIRRLGDDDNLLDFFILGTFGEQHQTTDEFLVANAFGCAAACNK